MKPLLSKCISNEHRSILDNVLAGSSKIENKTKTYLPIFLFLKFIIFSNTKK